ncbi:hypothetical protein SAMN03080606_03449 [Alkaliphilus peptidifermentans DSM 18978]|uniref:Uncharacterized protein n=1 Tax=Alkaliphilus peptidifermentans DSM 18978 TaxID=1120976 RepID=A0A1G5KF03_9FIRM|nr:hypothetical protein SAMN03080606_03449 [Alkaliphilus peptidifermentans DSM 18978]
MGKYKSRFLIMTILLLVSFFSVFIFLPSDMLANLIFNNGALIVALRSIIIFFVYFVIFKVISIKLGIRNLLYGLLYFTALNFIFGIMSYMHLNVDRYSIIFNFYQTLNFISNTIMFPGDLFMDFRPYAYIFPALTFVLHLIVYTAVRLTEKQKPSAGNQACRWLISARVLHIKKAPGYFNTGSSILCIIICPDKL